MARTVTDVIGWKHPDRNDWFKLANAWGVRSEWTIDSLAPKGVNCPWCWDHDLCGECLGEYPHMCPMDCKDGTCTAEDYHE